MEMVKYQATIFHTAGVPVEKKLKSFNRSGFPALSVCIVNRTQQWCGCWGLKFSLRFGLNQRIEWREAPLLLEKTEIISSDNCLPEMSFLFEKWKRRMTQTNWVNRDILRTILHSGSARRGQSIYCKTLVSCLTLVEELQSTSRTPNDYYWV